LSRRHFYFGHGEFYSGHEDLTFNYEETNSSHWDFNFAL